MRSLLWGVIGRSVAAMLPMILGMGFTGGQARALPAVDALPVVKEYPDLFAMDGGGRVKTNGDWSKRREQIEALLLDYEYGHLPPAPGHMKAEELSSETALDGAATAKRYLLSFGEKGQVKLHLEMLIPQGKKGPFPVMLTGDLCWGHTPIPAEVIQRGYILAEFDRTELVPDHAGRGEGIYPLYPDSDAGALAVWAWGYHRAVDYLVTRRDVDRKHIALTGHSRGGKTVLLAGALDPRIWLTNPNDSGCGGASPYRTDSQGCERLADILKNFPYWFSPQLPQFLGHIDQMPFDQHFLLALVAPRALLLTNANGDAWANPSGAALVYEAAKRSYDLLGASERISNHYRDGGHAHNADDWRVLLDFADKQR